MPISRPLDWLLWIDASPARSGGLGLLALALLLALTAAPGAGPRRGGVRGLVAHPFAFALGIAGALLALRWPPLFYPLELNQDEAQMAAQAMKYATDPVPWRAVDGTTSGPLDSWWLLLPRLVGLPIGYASGRAMALLCAFGATLCLYGTLRRLGSEGEARLGTLPLVLFFALATHRDFLFYSSEQLPLLLTAGAVALGVTALGAGPLRRPALFASAVLFGALPFAKLQAGPVGALGIAALAVAVRLRSRPPARAGPGIALCVLGGLLVPAAILALVIHGGALRDLALSYPRLYDVHGLGMAPGHVIPFLTGPGQLAALVYAALLFGVPAALWLAFRGALAPLAPRSPLFWSAGLLGAAALVVFAAGRSYPHYALLLVHPLALFSGVLLVRLRAEAAAVARAGAARAGAAPALAAGLFVAALAVAQLSQLDHQRERRVFAGHLREHLERPPNPVVAAIGRLSAPGDRMAIWGWSPSFYVESGLVPATRDAIAQMAMFDLGRQDYYRERFLGDLRASRPRIFLDTDLPIFPPHRELPRHGHERFPALADYVAAHYDLARRFPVPGTPHAVRLYIRRDEPRGQSPNEPNEPGGQSPNEPSEPGGLSRSGPFRNGPAGGGGRWAQLPPGGSRSPSGML